MSPAANKLLEQALSLEEKDRASLAGSLILSLERPQEAGVQEAWDTEIQRRVEEMESGKVKGIPWSEVREQLFRGFA